MGEPCCQGTRQEAGWRARARRCRREQSGDAQCGQLAEPVWGIFHLLLLAAGQGLSQGLWKSLSVLTARLPSPCLLWLQEGAKEFAALHNPRSKCSGRRRRRHHVVGASCSNTPASAVAETREGDSDRDTGNEWASSSSGEQPQRRHPTAGALPGSPLCPARGWESGFDKQDARDTRPCPCCCGFTVLPQQGGMLPGKARALLGPAKLRVLLAVCRGRARPGSALVPARHSSRRCRAGAGCWVLLGPLPSGAAMAGARGCGLGAAFSLTPPFPARGQLPLPDPHQAEAEPGLLPAVRGGDAAGACRVDGS